MKKRRFFNAIFGKRVISFALALIISLGVIAPTVSLVASAAYIPNTTETVITTAGYNAYSLFNSGATSSKGYAYRETSTDAGSNPNSKSYTNNGYDIFGDSPMNSRLTVGMGLSFFVSAEVTERATLTVYAYDIDEGSNQIDYVYLVDVTTGTKTRIGNLQGMDETWTTTTLYIDPQLFTVGHTYRFENSIKDGGWWTWIRRVSIELALDGEVVPTPDRVTITDRSFSASIDSSGLVSTDLHVTTSQDATYTLEYTATYNNDQRGGTAGQTIIATPDGTDKNVTFRLESGAPRGTYQITVVLKDGFGNTAATLTAMAGYNARAVTYNSNGGSSNVPHDTTDYATGETATVLFNYIPSRTDFMFLGWSTDKDATVPEFTADGNKTFVIGTTDVVLYAIWRDMRCDHEFELTSKKAASCTADGLITYTCTKCEKVETETLTKLGGHNYQNGICRVCGAMEQVTDVWDGTVDTSWYDPSLSYFKLTTAEQLAGLAYLVNSGISFSGKTITLEVNIDLNGLDWTPIGVGTFSKDITLAFIENCFSGIFDGGSHTISNLKISNTGYNFAGLFGIVTSTIKNLGVINTSISTDVSDGYTAYCGNIAGLLTGGHIENCYAEDGSISSSAGTLSANGGIVGFVEAGGIISGCFASGEVSGNGYSAGIAGVIAGGEIIICYYTGNVTNTGNVESGYTPPEVGGIANVMSSGAKISDCFFIGELSSTVSGAFIGSINGDDRGVISNCYYFTNSSMTSGRVSGTLTPAANLGNASWIDKNLGATFSATWTIDVTSGKPVLKCFLTITFHTHEFTESSRTEPTCTGYGEIIYSCECGETMSVATSPKGHNYEAKSTTPATCTEDGVIIFSCRSSGCDAEKEQKIDALGHSYGSDNVCDVCSHEIEIHDHVFTDTTVDPTCTAAGYTEHACECGYTYKDNYIEQLGHAWDDGEVTVPATCTTAGIETKTCTRCFATAESEIAAGHDLVEEILYEATCTEDGSLSRSCSACGYTEFDVIPAAHDWVVTEVITEAACKTAGLEARTCSACQTSEEHDIAPLGHNYVNGICTRCEKSFIEDITKSDHLLYGMHFKVDDIISNYGPDLINEYGVLLDYNPDAQIERVAVYLMQDGTMWRRCIAVTGKNIKYATYVPYLAYGTDIKYTGLNSDWINVFPLSENSSGIWCYSDYVTIGVNLQDAKGNLLLSLYNIGEAGAKTRIFDDLDEMISWLGESPTDCKEHVESDWIVDKEPTCTPGSRHTECTTPFCGVIIRQEALLPILDHTPSDWIVDLEPSLTTAGSRHKECTDCGELLEEGVMAPLATLSVENVTAECGTVVKVAVTISNNPGISGAVLSVSFDEALTLVDATAGGAWTALTMTRPGELVSGASFVWDSASGADSSCGSVIILSFEVADDAQIGDAFNISISYTKGNIIDAECGEIDLNIENGSITVGELRGDANDDGVVDVADVIALRRYLAGGFDITVDEESADMNEDGAITIADVVLLRRQLLN